MADNYLQFSEIIPNLSADEEAWLKGQLQPIHVYGGKEYPEDAIPAELVDTEPDQTEIPFLRDHGDYDPNCDCLGFRYAFHDDLDQGGGGRHLWAYAEEHGNPHHIVHLVQKLLMKFRPHECWGLTYACTCSKPRAGEFGGGAVFVTAERVSSRDAGEFLRRKTATFEATKKSRNK